MNWLHTNADKLVHGTLCPEHLMLSEVNVGPRIRLFASFLPHEIHVLSIHRSHVCCCGCCVVCAGSCVACCCLCCVVLSVWLCVVLVCDVCGVRACVA